MGYRIQKLNHLGEEIYEEDANWDFLEEYAPKEVDKLTYKVYFQIKSDKDRYDGVLEDAVEQFSSPDFRKSNYIEITASKEEVLSKVSDEEKSPYLPKGWTNYQIFGYKDNRGCLDLISDGEGGVSFGSITWLEVPTNFDGFISIVDAELVYPNKQLDFEVPQEYTTLAECYSLFKKIVDNKGVINGDLYTMG